MKLFRADGVYWGVNSRLFFLSVSMLALVGRGQAGNAGVARVSLASVGEVEARLAMVSGGSGELGRTKAAVLVFVGQDCPISNAMMPEMNRIVEKYEPLGVMFYFVDPESDVSDEDAARHAKDYGLGAPVVVDRDRVLAAKAGVKVTPEAAVFGSGFHVLYRGRINDLYAGLGKRRPEAQTQDLRDALDAVVAGKMPRVASTQAVGCFISPKP